VRVLATGPEFENLKELPLLSPELRLLENTPDSADFSLACTCRNEEESILLWLDSIKRQSLLPGEVIIVDGGSNDDTARLIQDYIDRGNLPFKLRLEKSPPCNIATGRNRAIELATNDVVLLSDAGCELSQNWCELLVRGFADESKPEVVMGFYQLQQSDSFGNALARMTVSELNTINPSVFLPSARSLGLKKTIWQRAGRYPQQLRLAGEDSLFDLNLKALNPVMVFVPEAIVHWAPEDNIRRALRTIYRYSFGDAEGARLGWRSYAEHCVKLTGFLAVILLAFALWHRDIPVFQLAALALASGYVWFYIRPTYTLARLKGHSSVRAACIGFLLPTTMALGFTRGVLQMLFSLWAKRTPLH
jgi:glycosyltransferase involved in cell wall biosynthesis